MYVYEYRTTRHRIAEVGTALRSPRDAYVEVLQALFAGQESESLAVLALDVKNHVIGVEVVYRGNVSASLVRVGELFRFAVRVNAASIMLAHNHPSGDPTPSPDDLHLTAECIAAGKLLDINVLDHVIVGDDAYTSLRDRGINFDRGQS